MATGEGKTLVAVLPAALNALAGRGVHVFTANDYLARRDAAWMGAVYRVPRPRRPPRSSKGIEPRRTAGRLRRRRHLRHREGGRLRLPARSDDRRPRRGRAAAVPLRDRGRGRLHPDRRGAGAAGHRRRGAGAARPARRAWPRPSAQLQPGVDFGIDEYARNVALTDAGFRARRARCSAAGRCTCPASRCCSRRIHVALHARGAPPPRPRLHRPRRPHRTGRRVHRARGREPAVAARHPAGGRGEGRAWRCGPKAQVLGSIPIQHFVRLWPKIAGMTATAEPSAIELREFYGLRTVVFPPQPALPSASTNPTSSSRTATPSAAPGRRDCARARPRAGRCSSARRASPSRRSWPRRCGERRVKCRVLNARHDAREALIVSRAGMPGRRHDLHEHGGPRHRHRARAAATPRRARRCVGARRPLRSARTATRAGAWTTSCAAAPGGRATRARRASSSASRTTSIRRYGVLELIPRAPPPGAQDGPVEDPVVARAIAGPSGSSRARTSRSARRSGGTPRWSRSSGS